MGYRHRFLAPSRYRFRADVAQSYRRSKRCVPMEPGSCSRCRTRALPESRDEIQNPTFARDGTDRAKKHPVVFEEHEHAHRISGRSRQQHAAVIHVMADAAISVLVIVGLLLARALAGSMDPLAGIVGA